MDCDTIMRVEGEHDLELGIPNLNNFPTKVDAAFGKRKNYLWQAEQRSKATLARGGSLLLLLLLVQENEVCASRLVEWVQ